MSDELQRRAKPQPPPNVYFVHNPVPRVALWLLFVAMAAFVVAFVYTTIRDSAGDLSR